MFAYNFNKMTILSRINPSLYKLVILLIIVLLVFYAPLLLIWCINVLFGTGTLITFKVWFAALLIILLIFFS